MSAVLHALGGAGPELLLIHGFGGDRLSWSATAPALAALATVRALELPGHGTAGDDVGSGDARDLAARALDTLAALGGPAVVVGHSLGGAVALELARQAPAVVRSLVLIAPLGFGRIDGRFLDALPELADRASAMALLGTLVEKPHLIQPPMADHLLAGLALADRRAALRRIAGAHRDAPPAAWPPARPARLIWGMADRVNRPHANAVERFGPALTLLPAVGHLPQIEAMGRVNRMIAEALAAGNDRPAA